MIVYRDAYRDERATDRLDRLLAMARRLDVADVTELLVQIGELEQGLLDALHPHRDGWGPLDEQLRHASLSAGEAFVAALAGRSPQPAVRAAERALAALRRRPLPATVRIRPPEGYVHYALNPAGYAQAAGRYRRDVGEAQAARALVVGIRSIGTSLAAVVAAATGAGWTITVRPRGRTGDRHVAAGEALVARARQALACGGDVLVVDEGPGATGETLASVVAWLRRLGVGDERIVLFPSRTWGMPLAPPERQVWFARARKYELPRDEQRAARAGAQVGVFDLQDLSEGRWRSVVPGAAGEPACTGHERRKYLGRDGRGVRYVLRYAGLGSWGEAARQRAMALAEAGIGPQVAGATDGFLALEWVEGASRPPARRARRTGTCRPRYAAISPHARGSSAPAWPCRRGRLWRCWRRTRARSWGQAPLGWRRRSAGWSACPPVRP